MAKSDVAIPRSHGHGALSAVAAVATVGLILAISALGFARESWDSALGVKENRSLIDAQALVVIELGKASTQNSIDMAFIRGSLEQLLGKTGTQAPGGNRRPHGG